MTHRFVFAKLVTLGALAEHATVAAGDPDRPATVIRCASCGETWDREPSEGIGVVRADRAAAVAHVRTEHPERFAALPVVPVVPVVPVLTAAPAVHPEQQVCDLTSVRP